MKYFVMLLLCCAALAQDDQPVTFRGANIGQSLSDYADCSSGKAKGIKDGYKAYGKLCQGKRGMVTHTHARNFMDPSPVGEWLLFESQKLVEIKIFVKNEDWAKTKYDLTEKLGQPVSEVPQVFQNAFGARWEYPEGFWLKGNTVAVARVKVSNEPKTFAILSPADQPITHGIEITITDSDRAKLPSKTPNSLD